MNNETTTWWEVNQFGYEIKPVTVVHRTPEFITVQEVWLGRVSERRCKINGGYYETYEAARAHLVDRARYAHEYAERALDRARADIDTVNALPEHAS